MPQRFVTTVAKPTPTSAAALAATVQDAAGVAAHRERQRDRCDWCEGVIQHAVTLRAGDGLTQQIGGRFCNMKCCAMWALVRTELWKVSS